MGYWGERGLGQAITEEQSDRRFSRSFRLMRGELQCHHQQTRLIANALIEPLIQRGQTVAFDGNDGLADAGLVPGLLPYPLPSVLRQRGINLQQ